MATGRRRRARISSPRATRISARTLLFVRHGETEWNAAARMQGQQNSNLNERGRRQAEQHGRLLAQLGADAMHVSPLDRARQTAEIIGRHLPLEPRFHPRIMEWDCGLWSGHLRADVRTRWPQEWAALAADPFHYRGPGCENYPDMIARCRPFIDELLASEAKRIAVISHGMIGRVMVGMLMGFDEAAMIGFKQPNDVVYRVRWSGDDSGQCLLDRFEAGAGPFDGVVPRQASR